MTTDLAADGGVVQRRRDMHQLIVSHQHLVLFMQEVLCWERPIWAVIYVAVVHFVWALFTLNSMPPLAFVCAVLLGMLFLDGCWTMLGSHMSATWHRIPKPLPASAGTATPVRHVAGVAVAPLRSLDDLARVAADIQIDALLQIDKLNRLRKENFGRTTVFCVTLCLLLSLITSYFPSHFLSYSLVLAVVLGPPLERIHLCRTVFQKVHKYIRMAVIALDHFAYVLWQTFTIEPVTDTELQRRRSAEEEALFAYIHGQAPIQTAPATSPAGSDDSFELVGGEDIR